MIEKKSDRAALIGCAIGAAVVSLTSNGLTISRENILYELERMMFASSDFQVKSINREAAELLRKSG